MAHLLPNTFSNTSDKMSEQLVRAMQGISTRVIFALRHRDLDSRRCDDAQLYSRRRDDAQPDSRYCDLACLDYANFHNTSLDDTAGIDEDHCVRIFVDTTSLKYYV